MHEPSYDSNEMEWAAIVTSTRVQYMYSLYCIQWAYGESEMQMNIEYIQTRLEINIISIIVPIID